MAIEVKAFRKAFYNGSLVYPEQKVFVGHADEAKSWGTPTGVEGEPPEAEEDAKPAPAAKPKASAKGKGKGKGTSADELV